MFNSSPINILRFSSGVTFSYNNYGSFKRWEFASNSPSFGSPESEYCGSNDEAPALLSPTTLSFNSCEYVLDLDAKSQTKNSLFSNDDKKIIQNQNFFDVFKFFNKTKENTEHHLSYYHSSGIKVHIYYKSKTINNDPRAYIQLEGYVYNSIFIKLDKSNSIIDISNVDNTPTVIALNILKNIEGIPLLAEALGINICIDPLELLDEIKKFKISKIKITKDISIISNKSILIGKNIFDILKFINPHETIYPFMHSIYVTYETDNVFTSMIYFGIKKCKSNVLLCKSPPKWKISGPPNLSYLDSDVNQSITTPGSICIRIYLDNNNMVEYIDAQHSNNPFGAEFILNHMKNMEGIPLIAEALGIKMNYTDNEIGMMHYNF